MTKVINQRQLSGAKLFSTRDEFLISIEDCESALEVGVLAGDFTQILLDSGKFRNIELVDTFESYDWFSSENLRFTEQTHYKYIVQKFGGNKGVTIHKGLMQSILPALTKKFDFIYIDADPRYHGAKFSLKEASRLLSQNGILGINDYVQKETPQYRFGVIEAVNEFLLANSEWEVIAFAFNENMFSDIFLRKP